MVPDYYEMLGIASDADRSTIEKALARCQPAWSSGTRNPKTKHTFQSYLDQIPALRRTLLGSPAAREAYDAELEASRRAERDFKLDELQRLVRLRAAKGGLTVTDRDLLRDQAARLGLVPSDLDRMIERIPPLPEGPATDEEPPAPANVIDPAMRRQIRITLDHLRRRDLYHVLDVPHDAPLAEIQRRAEDERRRWMQKSQVTAEKTAWLEAITYAQSHLGNSTARDRYDRTLIVEREESFLDMVSFAIQGLQRLDAGTRSVLIDEATARGILPERAERLLAKQCRHGGVALDGVPDAPTGAARLLRCRSCSGIHVTQRDEETPPEHCRYCGSSLRWECPLCRRGHWVDVSICSCGFPIEQLEPVAHLLEAAQEAYRTRDYRGAEAQLRIVLGLFPKHVGARRGLDRIKQRLAEIQKARGDFELVHSAGKLVAARVAVDTWARLVEPEDADVAAAREDVTRRLRDAAALVARGERARRSHPALARDLFRQALALAADHEEAARGLQDCPPEPPTHVVVEDTGLPVRLRWKAAPPDGLGPVSHRVVRKRDGVPSHAADGQVIIETPGCECADAGAIPGETYGYAVFSRRENLDSIQGAGISPFVVVAEVENLVADAQRGEVVLSWKPPAGSTGVLVVRKAGSVPADPTDGERVESLADRAIDRGLNEDRVVHYGVFALYRNAAGKVVVSRGRFTSALPHAPGDVVELLTPRPESDGRLRLNWRPPSRGQVLILRTSKPLSLAPGTRLDRTRLRDLDGQWLDASSPGEAFDPHPPFGGACHYTPLTSWSVSLTVGRGVGFSNLSDPSQLRAERVSGSSRIHLRWRWGHQGGMTLLVARAGAFPVGPDDPLAERHRVTEAEYARLGYYRLNLPPVDRGAWHIALYSVAQIDGERVVSRGLASSSRLILPGPHPEVVVSYQFRPARFPGRRWSIVFRTEPPGRPIPAMALVVHARTLPLSVEDGEIVDQFPPSTDGTSFRIRSRLNLARHRARVFVDPRANHSETPPIRLRHPETGTTRV